MLTGSLYWQAGAPGSELLPHCFAELGSGVSPGPGCAGAAVSLVHVGGLLHTLTDSLRWHADLPGPECIGACPQPHA